MFELLIVVCCVLFAVCWSLAVVCASLFVVGRCSVCAVGR